MADLVSHPDEIRVVSSRWGKDATNIDRYLEMDGYKATRKALEMTPDAIINEVKLSNLRGRGGAGFPTGMKWSFVPKESAKPKYVLVNGDESEPGTCKDRLILEQDPHSVIEGVIIAGLAYFADPTDIGTYAVQDWGAFISAVDTAGGYGTSTTAINKELITLRALNVTQSINYGSLSVLSDTGTYNATTTVQNLGNDRIDISIAGTNLTSGASSIPVTNEKFSTSTFTYSTCTNCNALATTTTPLDVNLLKPTTTAATTGNVFWGIAIPFGAAASAHQGQNTFYAIANF